MHQGMGLTSSESASDPLSRQLLSSQLLMSTVYCAGAALEDAEEPEEPATAADKAFIDDEGVEDEEPEQRAASARSIAS